MVQRRRAQTPDSGGAVPELSRRQCRSALAVGRGVGLQLGGAGERVEVAMLFGEGGGESLRSLRCCCCYEGPGLSPF